MATPVIMPRQGQSVESCIITTFNKKPGDPVNVGDILFSYETDKAAFEEEAKTDGTLLAILFDEGDDVPCLETVCVIGEKGEDISSFLTAAPAEAPPNPEPPKTEAPSPIASQPNVSQEKPQEIRGISPRAKRAAEKAHVNPAFAVATGPNGRIIERDIIALAASGTASTSAASADYTIAATGTGIGGRFSTADITAEVTMQQPVEQPAPTPALQSYTDEPLTNMRKVIAKAMHNSLAAMAQLTHNASFDATDIMAMRKNLKEKGEALGLAGVTLNDILLYAVSRTLAMPEHRALNAHFLEDKMRYFNAVNLGIAVDTPRGLMVPTLFDANRKSLRQISEETKALAKACIAGNINPDSLQGGTFTVSNLGALEIESFTPVINPPQTGILGVNTITYRVRADGSTYPAMALSLTYDHRALDGAPASRFLLDLKRRLESFSLLLALG